MPTILACQCSHCCVCVSACWVYSIFWHCATSNFDQCLSCCPNYQLGLSLGFICLIRFVNSYTIPVNINIVYIFTGTWDVTAIFVKCGFWALFLERSFGKISKFYLFSFVGKLVPLNSGFVNCFCLSAPWSYPRFLLCVQQLITCIYSMFLSKYTISELQ